MLLLTSDFDTLSRSPEMMRRLNFRSIIPARIRDQLNL